MMTARDSLLHEILTLTKRPYSKQSQENIDKVLTGYRIQAKSSIVLQEAITARKTLEEAVLQAWQTLEASSMEDKIKEAIDHYRMQFKQNSKNKITKGIGIVLSVKNTANLDGRASSSKKKASIISLSPKTDGGPIAGGHKKRQ